MRKAKPVYRRLVIVASSSSTDIWLGDDRGFLVQKETGTLDTSVEAGNYVVEFGLGNTAYPVHLTRDTRFTEFRLKCGPSCPRPIPNLLGKVVRKRSAIRRSSANVPMNGSWSARRTPTR